METLLSPGALFLLCGGKGAGRYPLKNVNSCLVVQRFPRSPKPWQVQVFTGKPGGSEASLQHHVKQIPRLKAPGDGGRKPTPVAPSALLVTAWGQQ